MPTLKQLLDTTTAMHRHLCPRQVLGVRMGLYAGDLLGLALPQADKRLYTIVETDGCAADGVAAAVNCWVGRRTMRIEDYGKVAATFVDTQTGQALRLVPRPTVRGDARAYAPQAANKWEAQLVGYQLMPVAELFDVREVALRTPIEQIISRPGRKDRGLNNFPTRLGKRHSAIVPLRQDFIKHDAHGFLEIVSHFAAGLVDLVNDMHKGFQAGLGLRFRHQFLDQRDTGEDHPLTGARHMGK